MTKPIQWAIMGLDLIADEFARHLNRHNALYAVCSGNPVSLHSFSKKYQVKKSYTALEEMLQDENVSIVYISTLGDEHTSNIMLCLQYGKHVFCEKTMFSSSAECKAAMVLAQTKHLFLGEAMTIFYMPIYEKIKQMIAENTIGTLKMVRADFGSLKEYTKDNPLFSITKKGGVLLDTGIYALSFIFQFLSTIPNEHASTMFYHSSGVDEFWNIILKNEIGEIANANLSLCAKLPKRAMIAGDKGYFLIDSFNRADYAQFIDVDGNQTEIHAGSSEEAVTYEILGVEKAIKSDTMIASNLHITLQVVSCMEQLLTKHKN